MRYILCLNKANCKMKLLSFNYPHICVCNAEQGVCFSLRLK